MRDNFEKAVGKRIAQLRKECQLTQEQFAERLNVAPETISRLERGVSIPSLKTFDSISHILDIPLKDIFDFEYSKTFSVDKNEKEVDRVVSFLKTKKVGEIQVGFQILRDVFKALKGLPGK